jgi:hypothetical protein
MYVANADGSAPARVFGGDVERALYLVWSPDGTRIAFVRQNFDIEREWLSVLDIATRRVRNLVSQGKLSSDLLYGARVLHLSAGVVGLAERKDWRRYRFRAAGSAGGQFPNSIPDPAARSLMTRRCE